MAQMHELPQGTSVTDTDKFLFRDVSDTTDSPEGTDKYVERQHMGLVTQTDFDNQGPSGRLLTEATSTTYQSGITTAQTNVTGLSVTFTVGSRPVLVRAFLPMVANTNDGSGALGLIKDAGGTAYAFASGVASVANGQFQIILEERITTPGEYTRLVALQRWGAAGTVTNNYNPATNAVMSRLSVIEQ